MPGSLQHALEGKRSRWISKPLSASKTADFPVVAIGASAGGLDACRKLLDALPGVNGMAFIIVQHLDPSHDSMMVDLLAGHTAMPVLLAADGMPIECDRVYVIPPGVYLSVDDKGALRISKPQARHGARLPFDFLLNSLAREFGPRAVCVVLSGTGADGSLGLKSVKANGGLVIAQDIREADYDGMPRSAVATGAVDLVLRAAKIAEALVARERGQVFVPEAPKSPALRSVEDLLPDIIAVLRNKTVHDFTLYKHGTLERRIERRMALAGVKTAAEYFDLLHRDASERDQLSRDLLINVTGFFRDRGGVRFSGKERHSRPRARPPAGSAAETVGRRAAVPAKRPIRSPCYFAKQIDASKREIKLQIFATDVDPDAVASARDGLYPDSIEADVPRERLARFFTKEDHNYRISAEVRANVVFTVHDVLADPPFARLDFVSCRNLLIYLLPEAQAKVISIIHFALREGGLLLVGDAETVGVSDGRFVAIAKPQRIYRRVGGARPGDFALSSNAADGFRFRTRPGPVSAPSRQIELAELCRRLLLDAYGPAAVLINRKLECLYFQGSVDRYLKVVSGRPVNDLIAMAREGLRTKLRSAVQLALSENARVVMPDGRTKAASGAASLSIVVIPAPRDREDLFLVCFVEEPEPQTGRGGSIGSADVTRVAELERELEATKTELQGALRNLEISSEEQMAINEEALSVNEEYQSTNEELLASKEELQSLNEELNALNSQLQETLERQRTTSDDLQNVLYSTKVATIFLDTCFNIRFFTPATRALFNVIPSDVGRPLTDLKSLAADEALVEDAQSVLKTQTPVEREIEGQSSAWFIRRIMPYRASDEKTEGVVITYEDITERRRTADALTAAKRQAELASIAKTRFLAAASHDLRQPLQTLSLLQGLLEKRWRGKRLSSWLRALMTRWAP